jgi:1,4-dihydroxy-2-naphthoate octaprenyltransferase
MINDALDFKKGFDTKERLGPLRVTQNGLLKSWQVLAASFGFICAAFFLSIPLIQSGGLVYMYLTMAAVLFSYLYTGGPFPLSSTGLSEPFVVIFYGFVATLSAYYLQMHHLNASSWIAATQIGLLATGILVVNNLRDVHQDAKTGKKTLAVRFGIVFGKWELTFILFTPYVLNLYYWLVEGRFLPFFLPFASILIAVNIVRGIWNHEPSRLYNRYLAETAILTLLFGVLLVLGFRAA